MRKLSSILILLIGVNILLISNAKAITIQLVKKCDNVLELANSTEVQKGFFVIDKKGAHFFKQGKLIKTILNSYKKEIDNQKFKGSWIIKYKRFFRHSGIELIVCELHHAYEFRKINKISFFTSKGSRKWEIQNNRIR